jgi:hypothetical protein
MRARPTCRRCNDRLSRDSDIPARSSELCPGLTQSVGKGRTYVRVRDDRAMRPENAVREMIHRANDARFVGARVPCSPLVPSGQAR